MTDFALPERRPGTVDPQHDGERLVAFFPNAAPANAALQFLPMLGVPADQIGVTTPDRMPRGQGLLISIALPDPAIRARVEGYLRSQGARLLGPQPQEAPQ
ncbi:MAG: hypothetical protein U0800_02300 [Isosphaeraceae bacterium]